MRMRECAQSLPSTEYLPILKVIKTSSCEKPNLHSFPNRYTIFWSKTPSSSSATPCPSYPMHPDFKSWSLLIWAIQGWLFFGSACNTFVNCCTSSPHLIILAVTVTWEPLNYLEPFIAAQSWGGQQSIAWVQKLQSLQCPSHWQLYIHNLVQGTGCTNHKSRENSTSSRAPTSLRGYYGNWIHTAMFWKNKFHYSHLFSLIWQETLRLIDNDLGQQHMSIP